MRQSSLLARGGVLRFPHNDTTDLLMLCISCYLI